jgi:heat shock protein HslJ
LYLLLFILAGCQSTSTLAPSNPLNGTAWLAWDIDGHGPGAQTYATLVFNGTRVAGSSGCNRFSGVLQVSAKQWHATDIAVTRMLCAPELMKEEASFLAALGAARFHSIDGGLLTLIDQFGATRLRLVHLSRAEPTVGAQAGFIGPRFTRGLPAD